MTVDRDNDGLMYPYIGEICGASSKDVPCAWLIAAIVFLGLMVLSLV
jgi:hypothetical protein